MLASEGLYTREVAETVASGIAHLLQSPDDTYILLRLVRVVKKTGQERALEEPLEVSIRLLKEKNRIVPLANGRELVRCYTQDGRRLDIFMPGPNGDREIERAVVILEEQ